MSPLEALLYSFLFGLLHGILPDEHTWPITFSYAIGGASGKEGIKAGLYFSSAFTIQRMLISELSYLALAPFLMSPSINGIVYFVVGLAMSAAGAIVLRKNRYPHIHVGVHWHEMPAAEDRKKVDNQETAVLASAPPARWTLVHGFIAGFGFGGFSLFVNTVAAPAMPGPWLGFLPGLLFGLGTMIVLALIGGLFGTFLQHSSFLTAHGDQEARGTDRRADALLRRTALRSSWSKHSFGTGPLFTCRKREHADRSVYDRRGHPGFHIFSEGSPAHQKAITSIGLQLKLEFKLFLS